MNLSAPRTLRQWQVFVVGMIVLYVGLALLAPGDPVDALTIGLMMAAVTSAVVAVAVYAMRALRS